MDVATKPGRRRKKGTLPPLTPEQSRLAGENYSLAYHFARMYSRNRPDRYQDFLDCGVDGLVDAARAFDGSRGVKFSTLANKCTRSRISVLIRTEGRAMRTPPAPLLALDTVVGEMNEPALGPRTADWSPDFDGLIAPLDGPEREVIALRYRDGLTLRAIAERLGFSHETSRNIEARALARLRAESA